jgi:hypothetical protein
LFGDYDPAGEFVEYAYNIKVDDDQYNLELWDTPGRLDGYDNLLPYYYENVN